MIKEKVEDLRNIGISFSAVLMGRIKRIYARLGYRSPTRFIEAAVMEKLPKEENRWEEIEEALKHGTIKEGGDEGELS